MSDEMGDVLWGFIVIAMLIIVVGFACLERLDRIQQDVSRLCEKQHVTTMSSSPKL